MSTSAEQPPVDGYCDECGFDSPDPAVVLAGLGRQAADFPVLLAADDELVRRRPDPDTWSALEYACHVRDVLSVQRARIAQTLAEDDPAYVPMNRHQRLIDHRYNEQDPAVVSAELIANAREFVATGAALDDEQLRRTGLYNYPTPTDRPLSWLLHHTAHEVQHHLYDVRRVLS
jgi:DinB superfamily